MHIQYSEILIFAYPSLLGIWSQSTGSSTIHHPWSSTLLKGPNSASLAVLGLESPNVWSVTQSPHHWATTASEVGCYHKCSNQTWFDKIWFETVHLLYMESFHREAGSDDQLYLRMPSPSTMDKWKGPTRRLEGFSRATAINIKRPVRPNSSLGPCTPRIWWSTWLLVLPHSTAYLIISHHCSFGTHPRQNELLSLCGSAK